MAADTAITPGTSFESKLDLTEKILANRKTHQSGSSIVGMLLHGDPGTGKTSFVRFLGHLLGIELLVIEAPHITEEHIINIPFIVFKNENDTGTKGNQAAKANGPSIVLADSHLYSKLKSAPKISDEKLLKTIYASKQLYIKVWEGLGGNATTIPDSIKEFREDTKVILFIDEFFRQSSQRIKNILRGILNGKLGMHDLPRDAYIIYASNLNDEGVEPMATNSDFQSVEMENPDKDEWFSWFTDKFKDSDVTLHPKVIDAFEKLLTKEHLSSNDVAADVRASPRTWEQVLLYINSSLPCKDEKAARSLLTNIRGKFTHYQTGKEHDLASKVIDAVSKLIKQTSNIDVSTSGNKASEWRSTLEHQLEQKIKLGKFRTYVPVISGPPGIGKTSQVVAVADALNLRYIYIDCSTLDPEMIMGIPISEKGEKDENMKVAFSFPQLYKQIKDDIKKADAQHEHDLSADEKREYAKQKFKYLIFFDELNRTSTKVFNALRRVLLEKDFGHGLELPDDSIMLAAINPHDLGTHDLTSHMRDVLDIIDTKPSWTETVSYLEHQLKVKASTGAIKTARNTIIKMFSALKSNDHDKPVDERNFYLGVGSDSLYVSPREITTMVSNTAADLDLKLKRIKPLLSSDDNADHEKAFNTVVKSVFSSIKGTLSNAMHKHQVNAPEFLHTLEVWLSSHIDTEGIFSKKAEMKAHLGAILNPYFENPSKDMTKEIELINFVEGHDIHVFRDELSAYLSKVLEADEKNHHVLKMEHPERDLKKGKLTHDQEKMRSRLETFIRDIILAFKVNKVTAELYDAVRGAMHEVLQGLIKKYADDEDLQAEILGINSRRHLLSKT